MLVEVCTCRLSGLIFGISKPLGFAAFQESEITCIWMSIAYYCSLPYDDPFRVYFAEKNLRFFASAAQMPVRGCCLKTSVVAI